MKKLMKNKKGFTLVEVVVVLVIIAILIAIAVPSVMKYIDDANEAKYLAEARAAYIAVEAEYTKDYADDKAINNSIYDGADATKKEAAFKKELEDATGFEVKTIVTDPVLVTETTDSVTATKPSAITKYTITFKSPSSDTEQTVEITKNGTAILK